ncbi:MAG TPA: hypothetical protein VGK89_01890 [Candidatus Eisenbacteria bacterium]
MKARSRSSRHRAGTSLLALGALAAGGGWGARDPGPVLRRYYAPLARVERRAAPAFGAGVERWKLITARGDTVRALWRAARPGLPRPWTAVMMGGLQTGDRAALLLPPEAPFHVLAVDWPWPGSRTLTPTEFALQLPAIERAALRSPSVLALAAEAVARAPGVDPARIVLVGASLGVPPALAALRLTAVPDALVLVDGAADLELLMRLGLERHGWLHAPATVTAALAYQAAWPLEPALNARAASGLPVLLMNSVRDERTPRSAVLELHACLPRATVRWRGDPHLHPSQGDVISRLAGDADAWLRARDPGRAAGPEPRAAPSGPR